jgi:thiosulfate reductase cytochrome b subunit
MKRIYLHPLPLRIWLWVNAFLGITLLITGIQLRVPGIASLQPHNTPLLLHRYAGWAMAASFVFWLVYSLSSRHLSRQYGIRGRDLEGVFRQAKFYLVSIFKGEENPFRPTPDEKFTPLQKLAYGTIMCFFAPLLVITGVLLNDKFLFREYILQWDVVGVLDALHVMGAYVFALYLIVHIYMATLGRTATSHIRAMIVGYEKEAEVPGKEFTERI